MTTRKTIGRLYPNRFVIDCNFGMLMLKDIHLMAFFRITWVTWHENGQLTILDLMKNEMIEWH